MSLSIEDRLYHVHLVNPMTNAAGGSEWRALQLLREFSRISQVTLWSEGTPHSHFVAMGCPISLIRKDENHYPRGGIIIFVGVYFDIGDWILQSEAHRLVVIYNTFSKYRFGDALTRLTPLGDEPLDLVFASKAIARSVSLPGRIDWSPIDIDRFCPSPKGKDFLRADFSVGRHSRDLLKKHNVNDVKIYRALLKDGVRVRIMGGTCLIGTLRKTPTLDLLPACTIPADRFLRDLNIFLYRTSDEYLEPSGRVVTEAMASALPVVAGHNGGYAELIDHGRNGFLFETDSEAICIIRQLRKSGILRRRIGGAARETTKTLFSDAVRRDFLEWCLR